MEYYQVRSFLEVARQGNLTRAAGILNVSQSALSAQLKNLEDALGVELFTRLARGMSLTDAGRALVPHAEEFIRAGRSFERAAAEMGRVVSTASLVVGLNTDPTFLRMTPLAQAAESFGVRLSFRTVPTLMNDRALAAGDIDLGFRFGEPGNERMNARRMGTAETVVVVPKELAERPEELSRDEIARLTWVWPIDHCPYYDDFCASWPGGVFRPKDRISADEELVVNELVLSGRAAALIRYDEAVRIEQTGKAVIWPHARYTVGLFLAWRAGEGNRPEVAAVVKAAEGVWATDGRG